MTDSVSHAQVNGTRVYYELAGEGAPRALIHGSWVNAEAWRPILPGLTESESFRVFPRLIDRLIEVMPSAKRATIAGAAYVPQQTVPQPYAGMIAGFARDAAAAGAASA